LVESTEEVPPCPLCGGELHYRDSRKRIIVHEGGQKDWLIVRRYLGMKYTEARYALKKLEQGGRIRRGENGLGRSVMCGELSVFPFFRFSV